jgi:hypothetical protein
VFRPITGIIGSYSGCYGATCHNVYNEPVARKTEWIHRISAAVQILRASTAPFVDRSDVEQILQVSRRGAIRILHQLGAAELGRNLVIDREQLIARLLAVAAGEEVQYERRRFERVAQELAAAARDFRARHVVVQTSPAVRDTTLRSLPPAIRLRPGCLEIRFSSCEELLTRLFELSQAVANDYLTFELLAEMPGGR